MRTKTSPNHGMYAKSWCAQRTLHPSYIHSLAVMDQELHRKKSGAEAPL